MYRHLSTVPATLSLSLCGHEVADVNVNLHVGRDDGIPWLESVTLDLAGTVTVIHIVDPRVASHGPLGDAIWDAAIAYVDQRAPLIDMELAAEDMDA